MGKHERLYETPELEQIAIQTGTIICISGGEGSAPGETGTEEDL